MLKLCTVGRDRGPYPRDFRPDEVICLDCGCVMPCTLQVEHRRVFGHAHYCWGGPAKGHAHPVTGPRGTPLDLAAVGLSNEDRKRLQSADLSNLRDKDVAFVVGRLEQLDTEVAALVAQVGALRAALQEPVDEDEVTVMMEEWSNPRLPTLGDKIRHGLSRVLGQRAAAVLAQGKDES